MTTIYFIRHVEGGEKMLIRWATKQDIPMWEALPDIIKPPLCGGCANGGI